MDKLLQAIYKYTLSKKYDILPQIDIEITHKNQDHFKKEYKSFYLV